MNRTQLFLLRFYTWQLKIKTLGDLARWKAQHNAHTNAETLEALAKAYNGTVWEAVNKINQNSNTAEQTAKTKQKNKSKRNLKKMRITKKELNQNYNYIVRGGYCEFQTLLRTPKARDMFYARGVYGWNWDAYEIEASDGQIGRAHV